MKSRLMAISGWGMGLAVLFAKFSERCELNETAHSILDLVLSTLTATCFLLMAAAISREFAEAGKSPTPSPHAEKPRVLADSISFLLIIAIGLYFSLYLPLMHEPTRSSSTLGTLMLGFGVIYLRTVFTRLLARSARCTTATQDTGFGVEVGFSSTEAPWRRRAGHKHVKLPSVSNGFIAIYLVLFSGLLLTKLFSASHALWIGDHSEALRMIEPVLTCSALLWLGLNLRRIETRAAHAKSSERPADNS